MVKHTIIDDQARFLDAPDYRSVSAPRYPVPRIGDYTVCSMYIMGIAGIAYEGERNDTLIV
jgi:hypothetical protein